MAIGLFYNFGPLPGRSKAFDGRVELGSPFRDVSVLAKGPRQVQLQRGGRHVADVVSFEAVNTDRPPADSLTVLGIQDGACKLHDTPYLGPVYAPFESRVHECELPDSSRLWVVAYDTAPFAVVVPSSQDWLAVSGLVDVTSFASTGIKFMGVCLVGAIAFAGAFLVARFVVK